MNKFDRVLAVVMSAALFLGGLLVVTEVVTAAFERDPLFVPASRWSQALRDTTWDQPSFRFIIIGILVGALALLWLEFRPRGSATWQLAGVTPAIIGRGDLEQLLTRSVANVGEVQRAHVRLGARRLRIRVETVGPKASASGPEDAIRAAIKDTVTKLDIVKLPKVKIKVHPQGKFG